MLCLHCSPPTSDPRGTRAEGTAQFAHRHRGVFGVSSAPDGGPVSEAACSRGARAEAPSRHKSPTTVQVRTQRPSGTPGEQPDECDPHPRQPSREPATEGQSAHTTATTTPSETPAATLHYLTKHREEPSAQSRPTFASGHGQKLSEFTREISGPAGWAQQHSTGSNRWVE